MAAIAKDYLTPPELARLWRVTPETILNLIRSSRLDAFSYSPPGCKRPRWRISARAVAEFERRNRFQATPPRQHRKQQDAEVIKFF